VAFWEQTLSVDASTGLQITQGSCCGVKIPEDTTSSGHFLLYVSFQPTDGSTLAWASACRIDQTGRPVAGHANFGPNKVDTNSADKAFKIAVHELAHALGFSNEMFSSYKTRDSTGKLVPHREVRNYLLLFRSLLTRFFYSISFVYLKF
jgi:hypothetical protein